MIFKSNKYQRFQILYHDDNYCGAVINMLGTLYIAMQSSVSFNIMFHVLAGSNKYRSRAISKLIINFAAHTFSCPLHLRIISVNEIDYYEVAKSFFRNECAVRVAPS